MGILADTLLTEEARPNVVRDCSDVIEAEVASKSGVTGLMIKAAFKTIKAFKRSIVPESVNALLDDFVEVLEPYYAEFRAAGGTDVKQFVTKNDDRIADAMLGITDGRAQRSSHKTLVKAYTKLRPKGKEQVIAAMPRIGGMLQKHGL